MNEHFILKNAVEVTFLDRSPIEIKYGMYRSKNWLFHAKLQLDFVLNRFPFDTQKIRLLFRIPRVNVQNVRKVSTIFSATKAMQLHTKEFAKHPLVAKSDSAWHVLSVQKEVIILDPNEDNFKPEYHVSIEIQRESFYYVVNIGMPNALLAMIGFSVFLVPSTELVNRLTIILTILLTVIAFKFSVTDKLPVLSYNTLLDKYSLILIFTIFMICFECCLVP
jgi:hypothetical protein